MSVPPPTSTVHGRRLWKNPRQHVFQTHFKRVFSGECGYYPHQLDPIIVDLPNDTGPLGVAAAVKEACGFLPITAEYECIGTAAHAYTLSLSLELYAAQALTPEQLGQLRGNLERLYLAHQAWLLSTFDADQKRDLYPTTPVFSVVPRPPALDASDAPKYRVWDVVWYTVPPNADQLDPIIVAANAPADIAAAVQEACGFLPIMAEYEAIGTARHGYALGVALELYADQPLTREQTDQLRGNLQRLYRENALWLLSNFDADRKRDLYPTTPIISVTPTAGGLPEHPGTRD